MVMRGRVGVPQREVDGGSQRRRWTSDDVRYAVTRDARECRVCGGTIAAGEWCWVRAWTENARAGHSECGWYRPDDLDVRIWLCELQMAATGQARMTRSSLARLCELGLVRIRGGEYGVTELGHLLIARVREAVRQSQDTAAEGPSPHQPPAACPDSGASTKEGE